MNPDRGSVVGVSYNSNPPYSVQNGGPVMNPDRGSVVGVSYSSNPLTLCRMEDQ